MTRTDRIEKKNRGSFPWKWLLNGDRSVRLWTVPVVLLVVSILSFGVYASQQGFFWDDWGFAWARFFRGFQGLKDTVSVTRPMRAYIDAAFMSVFGFSPFTWQIVAILMRWLAAVTLWWLLRQIWPRANRPVFVVTLLFLVYPGFSQQAIALTYYYFWLMQVLLFLSLGLMVLAIRKRKFAVPAILAALLLSMLHLFSGEYYFGMELLRPVFLWAALAGIVPDRRKRLGRTALYYLPFALLLAIFLYWRFFIYKFPGYQPVLLGSPQASFAQGLAGLPGTILQTIITVSLGAWDKVLQFPVVTQGGKLFVSLYPWVLVGSLVGLIVYQERLVARGTDAQEKPERRYVWEFLVVGLIAILLAGIPYYFAGLSVWLSFPENRFTLSFSLGVAFLLVALLELLPAAPYRIALVSALAALAIGLHFYTGYLYRNENELQKTLLWQLTWRAPALRPNTLVLSDDDVFQYTDDEGLAFALNWTYAPENNTKQIPYAYFNISNRLGSGSLPALVKGGTAERDYLTATFNGSTDQMVVLYFSPPSCLRILNPDYDTELVSLPVTWNIAGQPTIQAVRFLSAHTLEALPLSNMDAIVPAPLQVAEPPALIFGSEPKHNWCYLFEKADLARQSGDWEQAARLGDEAAVNFYYPADLSEYLVFIEADTHVERWQDAKAYSEKMAEWAPVLNPALCSIWQKAEVMEGNSSAETDLISTVRQELRCPTR